MLSLGEPDNPNVWITQWLLSSHHWWIFLQCFRGINWRQQQTICPWAQKSNSKIWCMYHWTWRSNQRHSIHKNQSWRCHTTAMCSSKSPSCIWLPRWWQRNWFHWGCWRNWRSIQSTKNLSMPRRVLCSRIYKEKRLGWAHVISELQDKNQNHRL